MGAVLFAFDSTQNVVISPLPFTLIFPLSLVTKDGGRRSFVELKEEGC